jgi:hypothetical protein
MAPTRRKPTTDRKHRRTFTPPRNLPQDAEPDPPIESTDVPSREDGEDARETEDVSRQRGGGVSIEELLSEQDVHLQESATAQKR